MSGVIGPAQAPSVARRPPRNAADPRLGGEAARRLYIELARDLATRLGVTVRTVYRDLDELVAAGVPIRGTRGPSGGYELAEHYPKLKRELQRKYPKHEWREIP